MLRSSDDSDQSKGFFEKRIGNNRILIKYVQKEQIEEIYDKKVLAIYKNHVFEVVEESKDQISIMAMGGDYQEWLNLGMHRIDKGVYQKWIEKKRLKLKLLRNNCSFDYKKRTRS